MAISFVGAGAIQTGTLSLSIPVPSGYAVGDLLLIVCINARGTIGTAPPSSSWACISNTALGPTGTSSSVYAKFATASESSVSITVNSASATSVMLAYRGVTSYDQIGTYASGTGTAAAIASGSLTTITPNEYVVSIYTAVNTAATWTPPGSTTTRASLNPSTGSRGLLIVDELQTSAGASAARTASLSASVGWGAYQISLSPTLKRVAITTTGASTFTIPSDFNSFVSVEGVGAGGGSFSGTFGGGSGAGAYAISTAVTGLLAGGTAYVNIGSAGTGGTSPTNGGDTWFNGVANLAPTLTAQGFLAKGGSASTSTTGGAGGASASSVGTSKFSGGTGGSASGTFASHGGGGGAAGQTSGGGNGGAGYNNTTANTAAGGGGGGTSWDNTLGGTSANNGSNGISSTGGASTGATGQGSATGNVSTTTPPTSGTFGGGGGGGGTNTVPENNGANGSYLNFILDSTGVVVGIGGGGGGAGGGGGGAGIGGTTTGYGGGAGGSNSSVTANGGTGFLVFTYNSIPAVAAVNSNFFGMF